MVPGRPPLGRLASHEGETPGRRGDRAYTFMLGRMLHTSIRLPGKGSSARLRSRHATIHPKPTHTRRQTACEDFTINAPHATTIATQSSTHGRHCSIHKWRALATASPQPPPRPLTYATARSAVGAGQPRRHAPRALSRRAARRRTRRDRTGVAIPSAARGRPGKHVPSCNRRVTVA